MPQCDIFWHIQSTFPYPCRKLSPPPFGEFDNFLLFKLFTIHSGWHAFSRTSVRGGGTEATEDTLPLEGKP